MKSVMAQTEFKKTSKIDIYKRFGLLIVMIFIIAILAIIKPNFVSLGNITNVLRQISINGLLAIGMTFVIISGGIDLSVGSLVGLAGILAAVFAKNHELNVMIPVLIGCLSTLTMGFINGLVISHLRVPPFIQTLGMLSIARGIAYIICQAKPVNGLSKQFLAIGLNYWLGIPIPVLVLIVTFIIGLFILYRTKFGRYIFAIGGNEEAALTSGLKVKQIKIGAYAISGLFSGLAGVILASRVSAGLAISGEGYEFSAVAAVVIGGTTLKGGEGTMWGTILGVLLIGLIKNGMDLLGVTSYYQLIVTGAIIILSVTLDMLAKKESS